MPASSKKGFVLEADVGAGGGNDTYIEEGDAARVNSSGADLYVDFDATDFDVGVVGNEANITIVDDGHSHTTTSISGLLAADMGDADHGDVAWAGSIAYVQAATIADSTYASCYVGLFQAATGNNEPFYTDGGLTYDATSGTLSSTVLTEGGLAIYNSGETPGGSLGGTWANPTIDDLFIKLGGDTITAGAYDWSAGTLTMPKRTQNDDKNYLFNIWYPNLIYDRDTQICIEPNLPAAITITEVTITCDADPATELDWDLKWADAFIGLAGATLIVAIDTTNGTADVDAGFNDATVAAGKCIYVEFAADPDAAITQVCVKIRYDYD